MTTHGMSRTRLNKIWREMRQRCNNPNNQAFSNYGGKGIKVCKQWDTSFETFRDWALANGYDDSLTIDRVNSDKDYEPGNCQWITRAENTRRAKVGKLDQGKAKKVTFNGKSLTLRQWALELGVGYHTLYQRIHIRKLPLDKALVTEFVPNTNTKTYTYKNKTMTLPEWANYLGISYSTLEQRVSRLNWSIERALSEDIRSKQSNKQGIDTKNVTAFGETLSISEWSNKTGLSYMLIYQRLLNGKSPEEALNKKVRAKNEKS